MASYFKRRHRNAILDLTTADTVYKRTLRTISIKANPLIAAEEGFSVLTVSNGREVCEILKAVFAGLDDDQEHLVMLVMNIAGDVTGFKVLASGAMDHVVVDAKIVFRNALLLGAAQFIIAHNHPSGDLTPSPHDFNLTSRLAQLGEMMDLPLVDHIILAGDECVSMRGVNPEWFGG